MHQSSPQSLGTRHLDAEAAEVKIREHNLQCFLFSASLFLAQPVRMRAIDGPWVTEDTRALQRRI